MLAGESDVATTERTHAEPPRDQRGLASGPPRDVLTPTVLQPVYRIGVERVDRADRVQLLFAYREELDPRPPRSQT